jgi:chemotaxis-related protein WspD
MSNPVDSKEDGSCRNIIGVWGDRSCGELTRHTHCRNCPVYAQAGRRLLDREATSDYIEDWQERLATVVEAVGTAQRSVLVFRVCGEWLALPTRSLREIIEPVAAHPVPHRRDRRFGGLINVRGELIPSIDLGPLLSLGTEFASNSRAWARVLIVERSGAVWAFPVDEVDGVHRIQISDLRTPPVTVGIGSLSFTASVFSIAFDFIYLASTSAGASGGAISGRGVSLEAVRSLVKEARGAIKVHSATGDVGLLDEDLLLRAVADVCQ